MTPWVYHPAAVSIFATRFLLWFVRVGGIRANSKISTILWPFPIISQPSYSWESLPNSATRQGISVGKEKFKFKNELTSLDDKLRIADKVHLKYLELGQEKIKILQELLLEVGAEAEFILAKAPVNVKGKRENVFKFCGWMDDQLWDFYFSHTFVFCSYHCEKYLESFLITQTRLNSL